jgi:putative membrane protein
MKKILVNILALSLIVFFTACESKKNEDSTEVAEEKNEATTKDSDKEKDAEFAVEVANGGLYEVQMGTMALTKATSPEVKKFAQMMVDDHTKANNELKAIASKKSMSLPDVMSEDKQKKYYDLERDEKKEDFDKKFMEEMVDDHKEDIKKFEKEAENGNDPDLKSWAAEKLAILRHHLQEAERIRDAVKNAKK